MKTNPTLVTLLLFATVSCLGCTTKEGPLEKAGEKVDDAVDNVKDGQLPLHKKGTAERVGDDIDKALGTDKNR